jgi:hypothetical protein
MEDDFHLPHHPDHLLAMLAVGEFGMMHAGKPQEIRAPALEEFEITRVIDDAGEIRVGEIDPRQKPMARRRQFAAEAGGQRFFLIGPDRPFPYSVPAGATRSKQP